MFDDHETYLGSRKQNYSRDWEIATKGRIGCRKHSGGPDDHRGRHAGDHHNHCQTEFEYHCKN